MTPFRERMNLYRAYRELNPGKNYWDWKASLEVPAMLDGDVIKSSDNEDISSIQFHNSPTDEIHTVWDENTQTYKNIPRVIGMSGADPIGSAYVEGVAFTKGLEILTDAYKWKQRTDAVRNYRDFLGQSAWNRSNDIRAKTLRETVKKDLREYGGEGTIFDSMRNTLATGAKKVAEWYDKLNVFEDGGQIPALSTGGGPEVNDSILGIPANHIILTRPTWDETGKQGKEEEMYLSDMFDDYRAEYSKTNPRLVKKLIDSEKNYAESAITSDRGMYSVDGGLLPELVVYPTPIYATLRTEYPFVNVNSPFTGHSGLYLQDWILSVNVGGKDENYNLVTNNCSDATKRVLERTFGKEYPTMLFTTPGDVLDFAVDELNAEKVPTSERGVKNHRIKLTPKLSKRLRYEIYKENQNFNNQPVLSEDEFYKRVYKYNNSGEILALVTGGLPEDELTKLNEKSIS